MTSVTDTSDNTYTFTYDINNNSLSNICDDSSDYNVTYSYDENSYFNRVIGIQEAMGTTQGQGIEISYDDKKTTFRTSGSDDVLGTGDDLLTVYLFDKYGSIINIYTTNLTGDTLYNSTMVSYGDTDTFALARDIKSVATTGSGSPNLLYNSSFETSSIWYTLTLGPSIQGADSFYTDSDRFIGNQSKALYVPTANNSVFGAEQLAVLEAGTYTFSAYVKTSNIIAASGGALLSVYDSCDSLLANSEMLTGTTNTDIQNGWRRISVTFTLTGVSSGIYLHVGLKNATGLAYFDAVRLEKGSAYNTYNMLNDSGFESPAQYWDVLNTSYMVDDGLFGNGALRIDGSPSVAKAAYQTVKVNRPLGTNFVVSGWAKADSVHTDYYHHFGIEVAVKYDISLTEIFYIPFNDYSSDWQFASQAIVPTNTTENDFIKEITVTLVYSYNCNTAFFDNISLTIEPVSSYSNETDIHTEQDYDQNDNLISEKINGVLYEYTYDSNNNLLTVTIEGVLYASYTYDSNNNLISEIVDGVIRTYDSNGNMTSYTADDIEYTYTYDSNGNIISTTIQYVGNDPVPNGNDRFYTFSTYDSNNNLVGSTNERGKTTTYGYTNDVLKSITNPNGNTTNYTYTNDMLTKLWTVINGTEVSNNFTYDSNGNLVEIDHQGDDVFCLTYSFVYYVFGNLTSIKHLSTTLVTYTYNSNNGKLARADYANGFYEEYVYDAVDRIISVKYNGAVKYLWKYDEKGTLLEYIDSVNGTTEKYEYDEDQNLIRTYQIKTSTKAFIYTKEMVLNANNEQTGWNNIFADGTSKGYSYTYNDNGSISAISYSNGYTLRYTYDVFGRKTSNEFVDSNQNHIYAWSYAYQAGSGGTNASSNFIDHVSYALFLFYTYDDNGNIIEIIKDMQPYISYEYDALGQLTRENNTVANRTYVYSYDYNGNILSKTIYSYTTGTLLNPLDTITYSYNDTENRTRLTAYNGTNISYDNLGNPLNWDSIYLLNWAGRRLNSLEFDYTGVVGMTFKYNSAGIRTYKSYYNHNTMSFYEVEYILDGTRIINETREGYNRPTEVLYYYYDENDSPIGFNYNGTDYFYGKKNAQGDVSDIFTTAGTKVVHYEYDAWGNILSITGSLASTIGQINPFRYRSYYYDTETGLYYLQSRYYDPQVGRFLNADEPELVIMAQEDLLAVNLYAYCANNPVMMIDPSGYCANCRAGKQGPCSDYFRHYMPNGGQLVFVNNRALWIGSRLGGYASYGNVSCSNITYLSPEDTHAYYLKLLDIHNNKYSKPELKSWAKGVLAPAGGEFIKGQFPKSPAAKAAGWVGWALLAMEVLNLTYKQISWNHIQKIKKIDEAGMGLITFSYSTRGAQGTYYFSWDGTMGFGKYPYARNGTMDLGIMIEF